MPIKSENREINEILDILKREFPDAGCELNFRNNFELLIAVVLSAQTTDKSVNKVTPALFSKYPDARSMAAAGESEAEARGLSPAHISSDELLNLGIASISEIIRSIGMYRAKAKNLILLSRELTERHGGEVPASFDELTRLPGVGRKTANVVLSVGFGEQHIAVDTHVFRVSHRIGLAPEKDVLTTEKKLMEIIPEGRWSEAHHSLLFLGRYVCTAKKPACEKCALKTYCLFFSSRLT